MKVKIQYILANEWTYEFLAEIVVGKDVMCVKH
ncbi:hypothetical protein J2Z76_002057 [Sedimentibacter acidaminivorans]|uniref:Uncharacterized protein n=1 Tax=Sedimentibacter acidaminivorans TaxID=913099 RepID=A0ABS4GER9_9FIRM|nr:hypothetical protein [Sedimentibacter acidaminivorans]